MIAPGRAIAPSGRSPPHPASVERPPGGGPRGDAVEERRSSIWKVPTRIQPLRGSPPSLMLAPFPDMRQGESTALVKPGLPDNALFYHCLRASGPTLGFRRRFHRSRRPVRRNSASAAMPTDRGACRASLPKARSLIFDAAVAPMRLRAGRWTR
jgi:hypothetical protein